MIVSEHRVKENILRCIVNMTEAAFSPCKLQCKFVNKLCQNVSLVPCSINETVKMGLRRSQGGNNIQSATCILTVTDFGQAYNQ